MRDPVAGQRRGQTVIHGTNRTRRALGFSLKDIARLLAQSADCAPSLSLAQDQLTRVQKQIATLMAVAADLQSQIAACETDCADSPSATCLILPV